MPAVSLIAIDSSPQAEAAFQWYLDHIHREGTSIVVLHSVDLSSLSEQGDLCGAGSASTGRIWDHQKGKIKALEDKYRWKLNENGLAGKIRTESGKPGDVITEVARQEKATIIVIGSRGLGRFKRTIQGSVSDFVLHHAHCPVIICRQEDVSRSPSTVSRSTPATPTKGTLTPGTPTRTPGTPSKK